MANYYDSGGNQLKGNNLKKYLKALAAAAKSGKEYTGPKYYTAQEVEAMYKGAPLSIIQQLGKYKQLLTEAPDEYTGMTDEQLQAAAAAQGESTYNANKTIAQNQYNTTKNSLLSQLSSLGSTYDSQVASAQNETSKNVDTLTGSMLSRGLGRSSYAGALQGATLQAGANNVNSIKTAQTNATNALNGQATTLDTNYAGTLAALDTNRVSDAKTAYDTLKQQDYEKQLNTSDARTTYFLNLLNQKKKVSSTATRTPTNTTATHTNNTTSNSTWNLTDLINSLK